MTLVVDYTNEIMDMVRYSRTGDILEVRSKTIEGYFIRRMLSKGLHQCHTNHTAPVFSKCILQIEPPAAHIMTLYSYLNELYQNGGKAILLRPDAYEEGVCAAAQQHIIDRCKQLEGKKYDRRSIRMFARMIFRKAAHVDENDKEEIYCTEGGLDPLVGNPYKEWKPDILKHEKFPAPIHVEHLIRQDRLRFVAGDREMFDRIIRLSGLNPV